MTEEIVLKEKICPRCKNVKSVGEFYRNSSKKDGLYYCCKRCCKEKASNYYVENKEKICKQQAEYYVTNREKKVQYRLENREKLSAHRKEYYAKNREKICARQIEYSAKPEVKEHKKAYNIEYSAKNKEQISKQQAQYRAENKEQIRALRSQPAVKECANQREKARRDTDPQFRLRRNVSCSIRDALKRSSSSKAGQSCLNFLPFTIQQLKEHLESQFDQYMNWSNHGMYDRNRYSWQIDHVIPHSSFSYATMDCEEFRQCWSLSNLRPLKAIENIRKGNRIGNRITKCQNHNMKSAI